MPPRAGGTRTVQFRDFSGGINRTAARQGMQDNQAYWLENVQPIGPGQLLILPPQGPTVATIGVGIATLWGFTMKIGATEVGRLITINTDGSISAIDPTNGTVTAVAVAATVTTKCRITPWQDQPLLFGDPTKGYFSWDGTTFLAYPFTRTGNTTNGSPVVTSMSSTAGLMVGMKITGTGIPASTTILSVDSASQITLTNNATATNTGVTLTIGAGAPTSIFDLAVFEGRVWLLTGTRARTFTAPNSFTDFTTLDAAGTSSLTDSVFQGAIQRLLSALELLWEIGPSAINSVSNVQVVGAPATTTFTDTNIVANVGSILPSTVTAFFRTLLMLAPYGVYAIVGATPQKLSDNLDGLFPLLVIGADAPAAVFTSANVFVWAVLVTYADPVLGNRPVLLCFARNAWFVVTQGSSLTWITSLVDLTTGTPQLWGTDGTHVFRCFAGPASNSVTAMITMENESGGQGVTAPLTPSNLLIFVSPGLPPITWVGSAGTLVWVSAGISTAVGAVDFSGNYIGVKISSTDPPYTIQTKFHDFGAFTTRKQVTRIAAEFNSVVGSTFYLSGLALEIEPLGEWTVGS